MDFSFDEAQLAVKGLAAQIFEGHSTVERVKEVERRSSERFDQDLWSQLAKSNLLGIAVPAEYGGSGFGLMELCLVLEQQGRRVAPVPLWPTLVLGALPIARFGTPDQRRAWLPGVVAGDIVLTAALSEAGPNDATQPATLARPDTSAPGGWRLEGDKPAVPGALESHGMLVPARTLDGDVGVFLVDPGTPEVTVEPVVTTNSEIQGHVHFAGAPAEVLGDQVRTDVLAWMLDRALVGLCALQLGVTEEAIAQTAAYCSNRIQFGKPLSVFQGVALKAADAYIETEAIRVTLWQAAWRLAEGRDATREVLVAKWWAAEGGQRVVHITQHLHGGIGADIDYPIHRYFLWAKQLEMTLGGASAQLARLGEVIARSAS